MPEKIPSTAKLDVFASWEKSRRIAVALDNAYCNDTVLHVLASNIKYFGSMRLDAALTALPVSPRRRSAGSPSVRGEPLPKPEAMPKWQLLACIFGGIGGGLFCAAFAQFFYVPWIRRVLVGNENLKWYMVFYAPFVPTQPQRTTAATPCESRCCPFSRPR